MPAASDPENPLIRWSARPASIEPWTRTVGLLVVVAVTVALATMMSPVYGVLAGALLVAATAPYFLATHYELSEQGVRASFPLFSRNRPWSAYRRYAVGKDGIFLSQFDHPSRLDSFRGEFLRFVPGLDRDRVLDMVSRHVSVRWTGKK